MRARSSAGAFAVGALLAASASGQSVLWEAVGPPFMPGIPGNGFPFNFDAGKDVDGDGVPDAVAGAPFANTPIQQQGMLLVLSGVDGSVLFSVLGPPQQYAWLGLASVLVGDLDGDGRSEFASGAAGGVRVYSGASASLLMTIFPPTPPCLDWRPFDAGDVNGDGVPDLVLGCPFSSPGGVPNAGMAAVVSGADGSLLQFWPGQTLKNHLGWSAALAGDLDGDSVPDVIAGAPYFTQPNLFTDPGLSYAQLFSGGTGGLLQTYYSDFGNGCGNCYTTQFGWSVAGGGDVNGDGAPDVIVGETQVSPNQGLAVFSGAGGGLLYETADGTGWGVQHLGDVDGDGFGDFLGAMAGYYSNALYTGCFQMVLSPTNVYVQCGMGRVYSGFDGSVIFTLKRPGSGLFGDRTAAAGDLDGDDIPDVLVGDPGYGTYGVGLIGRVTAFSLAPIGVTTYGSGCPAGTSGTPRIGVRGEAKVGETIAVNLSRAPAGSRALLVLGLSDTAWGPVPLPLGMAPLGMPGCSLLASLDFTFPVDTEPTPPAPGRASVAFPIPQQPVLAGATLFLQWIVGASPGTLIPGGTTRALRIQIS